MVEKKNGNGAESRWEWRGGLAFVVVEGDLHEAAIGKERMVAEGDEAPALGEEEHGDAFLDGRPPGIAVGTHEVGNDFIVAHTKGFEQSH